MNVPCNKSWCQLIKNKPNRKWFMDWFMTDLQCAEKASYSRGIMQYLFFNAVIKYQRRGQEVERYSFFYFFGLFFPCSLSANIQSATLKDPDHRILALLFNHNTQSPSFLIKKMYLYMYSGFKLKLRFYLTNVVPPKTDSDASWFQKVKFIFHFTVQERTMLFFQST